jgi:hypothetical protein
MGQKKGAEVRRFLIAGFVAALVLGTAGTSSAFPKKGEVFTVTCGDASVTTHWTPVGMGADVAWGEDGAIYHLKSFDIRIYRGEFTTEPDTTPLVESSATFGNRKGQGQAMACSFRGYNPDHNATGFIYITVTTLS